MKKLNKALERMVLDVAKDRKKAQRQLNELIQEHEGTDVLEVQNPSISPKDVSLDV